MSQPFDRGGAVPAPKVPDERLKDWWVENPWMITAKGKSLSGYERNRIFLNQAGKDFYDISGLTGADSDGDGRSVVGFDFTGDGQEDLLVRQAGGGPLLVLENQFPKAHWLELSLRGDKSNRFGIGARVVAQVGAQQIVREAFCSGGFRCQGPAHLHFGLGTSSKVDKLSILWPSGLKQEFENLKGDRHLRITEGSKTFAVRVGGPAQ